MVHLVFTKLLKFVCKTDTEVRLRVTRKPYFLPWHPDESWLRHVEHKYHEVVPNVSVLNDRFHGL